MKVFNSICIILARRANYVLPIMFMMALSGCPGRPVGTYKTFPLTVVLADKLVSSAEDPLPKEAVKLVSPVYGKECNSGFIPRVRFLRADREPPEGMDLEPVEPAKLEKEIKQQRESEPMGWVRNMLEQKPSLEEIQKAISQSLKRVKSGGILAAEGTESPQLRAAITTLFQEKQAAGMLVLLPSEKVPTR